MIKKPLAYKLGGGSENQIRTDFKKNAYRYPATHHRISAIYQDEPAGGKVSHRLHKFVSLPGTAQRAPRCGPIASEAMQSCGLDSKRLRVALDEDSGSDARSDAGRAVSL